MAADELADAHRGSHSILLVRREIPRPAADERPPARPQVRCVQLGHRLQHRPLVYRRLFGL